MGICSARGEFYYYVIDSPTLTFDIVSPSTESLLGIPPEEVTLPGLIERVHPDDVAFMIRCEDVVAHFLKNCIPAEKMVRYKISYCLRERTVRHGYRLFLLQTITMRTTTDGALLKVFGSHTDITHLTDTNPRRLSFIGLRGEPSYMDLDVFDPRIFEDFEPYAAGNRMMASPYSPRELEIIRLMALGMTTQEIATRLFLSANTIETHRKNILRKSTCKNTTELVVHCIWSGYI